MNDNYAEHYGRLADLFFKDTGLPAPDKDDKMKERCNLLEYLGKLLLCKDYYIIPKDVADLILNDVDDLNYDNCTKHLEEKKESELEDL